MNNFQDHQKIVLGLRPEYVSNTESINKYTIKLLQLFSTKVMQNYGDFLTERHCG